ncbi:hypothetical protein K470DRAFT_122329 [Piedraia hortae CBS 480.64]|uniref:Alpha N-terminal protein methyltransferase 1 n=1 Tax=Piedraia hortae CBS 480.64 TaxID=1314780 RepID=A0A6A7C730_9PEZI|nr:hypothetical protein K470DRAFT_122329 [Piedraia hortae CBS 480.64]
MNDQPDSLINHEAALEYWSKTEATVNGVLGGYPELSRTDLQGSRNFLAKLHSLDTKLGRAVDCGAGIGRITTGFLSHVADVVDVVEPVKKFTDEISGANVGEIYNVGLQDWQPTGVYDLIWVQWCIGQLTDAQVVDFLTKLPNHLRAGGWVVVKENESTSDNDVFDDQDHSVTRTEAKFKRLFRDAGFSVVLSELQRGFPRGLFPVKTYALQPVGKLE